MNTPDNRQFVLPFRWVWLSLLFVFASISAQANPIEVPERPNATEEIGIVVLAIFFEALCVVLILRKRRHPPFFLLWVLAMHLATFPAFLSFLRAMAHLHPYHAVAIGEALVVIVEGILIYCICRFAPAAKYESPRPSVFLCWLASLAGNACSAAVFPSLLAVYDKIFS